MSQQTHGPKDSLQIYIQPTRTNNNRVPGGTGSCRFTPVSHLHGIVACPNTLERSPNRLEKLQHRRHQGGSRARVRHHDSAVVAGPRSSVHEIQGTAEGGGTGVNLFSST